MKVSIGADHGGVVYKEKIKSHFGNRVDFVDVGSYEINKEDNYAKIALRVGEKVASGEVEYGIMICRTGVGAGIALNKIKGIRAGVLENKRGVYLARSKNNINALSFGADNISVRRAIKIVEIFLNTPFSGGRHEARLKVIADYEQNNKI